MANQEQFERLVQSSKQRDGNQAWNQWRGNHPHVVIDLGGGDLHNADLASADLEHADLNGVNLIGAYLSGTRFAGADLRGADLTGVSLAGADLKDANLTQVRLVNAYLIRVRLSGADLTHATIGWTTFGDVDLRQVTGLDTIEHRGPSNLATNVFYQSFGDLPESFLRGCGVSDEMISIAHSIAGAIRYYSAFISYNHQDNAFATRLYNDLQANNVRCWKYTEDQKIGAHIRSGVFDAIRLHDKLLVILSASSLASDWVFDEVGVAMKREEIEHKTILFPVKIDDAIDAMSSPWAEQIRRHRNIGDFRAWKDQNQYQPMFERLLRDLKQASSEK